MTKQQSILSKKRIEKSQCRKHTMYQVNLRFFVAFRVSFLYLLTDWDKQMDRIPESSTTWS